MPPKTPPTLVDNNNGTITLAKADYNALIDRLNNAYKIVRDCDKLLASLARGAQDASKMIHSSLTGIGDPNPPVDLNRVP